MLRTRRRLRKCLRPTVTLEVTPEQAEKISVAAELGKLSLTLRSVTTPDGVLTTSTTGPGRATGVKPTWAGDVSPALGAHCRIDDNRPACAGRHYSRQRGGNPQDRVAA